jgi:hypothetical protein
MEEAMQVVHDKDVPWSEREEKHREGSLAFKNLFKGEEGDPNNFRWVLSRNTGDYRSPVHRHNFDQVRFCVQGAANIAPGKSLNEGDVGFFPEGTPYGPQQDLKAHRLTLVLQGGGASGLGYMSSAQLRRGHDELEKRGSFGGGRFCFHGQTETRDSYEAIWEHVFGRSIAYPPQRYDEAILIRTASFTWVRDRASDGVSRRFLGSFTERGTRLEMLRVAPDGQAVLGEADAMVLAFVVTGHGRGNAGSWHQHSAFRIGAGETLTLRGDELADLFVITLPVITAVAAS